ncbi:MAG: FAD-linked oxidase C-terminal domain-containing protein [Rubrivivax sp.]
MNHSTDASAFDRSAVAAAVQGLLPALQARLGERLSTAAAAREQHSHGEGVPDAGLPDAVVMAQDDDDVAFVLRHCNDARVPVVPYGTGTSLEGHVAAVCGGISLDVSRMDRVLEVSPEALDCRVQAGVTREQLNAQLREQGLFFPIDPGANASLGGMAATRASGTAAVRYGTMRDAVLGLTVVTADGRIVRTGTRARKTAAGLDLTRLFVGSEGLLGVITEVQLRLWGLPEVVKAAVCQFPDLGAAVGVVISALQLGVPVARIELLDDVQMDACIRYSQLHEYRALPTLFIEFHGSPAAVDEQIRTLQSLAEDAGGSGFAWAEKPEERSRLWKARHSCYQSNIALRPGCRLIGTDACVPISALAECLLETQADVRDSGLVAPIAGHAGDGNFHLGIVFDPNDAGERERADALAERVSMRAIRYGGTCTGEHGIGLHRIHQLEAEHPGGVALMRSIKQALDPNGILNPGKMLRAAGAAG